MEVQINTGPRFLYNRTMPVQPLNMRGDVVIVIDPGKTNMAMAIGSPSGTVLCIVQFSGAGRHIDNSDYCQDVKAFIKGFLKNVDIYDFGIEQAISKRGMNHHHSSMVLTEIRGSLIDLGYELTGKKPQELNNWSWKSYVLPEGYRSQSEKGSARYLKDWYNLYGNADVTDALCMLTYITRDYRDTYVLRVTRAETPIVPFTVAIYPPSMLNSKLRRFVYNPSLSIEENAVFYANRCTDVGIAEVTVETLGIEEIYKYATGFSSMDNITKVGVVVVRSSQSG